MQLLPTWKSATAGITSLAAVAIVSLSCILLANAAPFNAPAGNVQTINAPTTPSSMPWGRIVTVNGVRGIHEQLGYMRGERHIHTYTQAHCPAGYTMNGSVVIEEIEPSMILEFSDMPGGHVNGPIVVGQGELSGLIVRQNRIARFQTALNQQQNQWEWRAITQLRNILHGARGGMTTVINGQPSTAFPYSNSTQSFVRTGGWHDNSPTVVCTRPAGNQCGDGEVQQDDLEQCDDGNTDNGDGCSSFCISEGGSSSSAAGEACGNGIQDTEEECDDGNLTNGDSCSADCLTESGEGYTWGEECTNGIVEGSEQCDDGNENDNDGCTVSCLVESCGDGTVQTSEQCDDGNTSDDDGCSAQCVNEVCGDGIVQTAEQCDDENTEDNDGCSSSCIMESCGDGIVQTSEQCDDGNLDDNDGCSAICITE